jgi:hypothetical protein
VSVTGAEIWRQVITGASASGSASAVATDARGNVVAAGSISNNFTVVSLDPGVGITGTPSSGSGSFQIFSFNFLDPKGFANIFSAPVLIHSSLTAAGGCFLYYRRESNAVWLQNDSGSGWIGPSLLGSGAALQNSQCTGSAASSSASGSGSNLTLNLALAFTSAFSGSKNIYAIAYDNQGLTSNWQQEGTWIVP